MNLNTDIYMKYASNKQKDSLDFVLRALSKDGFNYEFISDRFKQEKSIASIAIKQVNEKYKENKDYFINSLVKLFPENILKNYDILREASIAIGKAVDTYYFSWNTIEENKKILNALQEDVEENKDLNEEIEEYKDIIELIYDNINYLGYTKNYLFKNLNDYYNPIKCDIRNNFLILTPDPSNDEKEYLLYLKEDKSVLVSLDTKDVFIGQDVDFVLQIDNLGLDKSRKELVL